MVNCSFVRLNAVLYISEVIHLYHGGPPASPKVLEYPVLVVFTLKASDCFLT